MLQWPQTPNAPKTIKMKMKRGIPFLKSLLLLLHSHRADLGPDTGEGKTQDPSLRTLEPKSQKPEDHPKWVPWVMFSGQIEPDKWPLEAACTRAALGRRISAMDGPWPSHATCHHGRPWAMGGAFALCALRAGACAGGLCNSLLAQ